MEKLSKAREQERVMRVNVLRCMAVAMRMYAKTHDTKWLERAKEFGVTSKLLATWIETHDYTAEDTDISAADVIHKRTVVLDAGELV